MTENQNLLQILKEKSSIPNWLVPIVGKKRKLRQVIRVIGNIIQEEVWSRLSYWWVGNWSKVIKIVVEATTATNSPRDFELVLEKLSSTFNRPIGEVEFKLLC